MAGVIGVSGSRLPMVTSADDGGVALGDHPRRTVVYGGALIIAAMVGATFVWQAALPGWLTAALLALTLVMALVGWLMTFRDLTPSRRRRRR
jgi:UDP-N-acetylmuramyl pentapeptide phosphotransferase/UDP-N-acetylglucosamine-1-phosphate transferase